ncbi:MAG: DUF1844 domain-containing protein [Candidatus Thermoplasmatota archaeon]|nr:DUF1844 domain-containing protein [Candidatus Thermoplasmatota archaeon]MEC7142350.1 DUF1844 domain-containing protein [Candidatus Thermoplasmatota archaeon]MEC7544426.1 DUF1844 domain-containing protein [Candidatus Thermoplasmatota archaeon]MEC7602225.1 DUF1844 domain-containing protein [Candidatus Thermoplasmatota archaeon]MEC7688075.1 DUF1844 domain-containing protein [Candidatus Thermoplasmatota archaeon]|tara:strand:- start:126 stop:515 length:390 start_codon:yes stop_codon:yes gene_type:complete
MNSPSDMFSDQYSERLFSVIQMLQRSALMNMGAIPDYEGMIHFNLGEAKAAIDAIEAVQSKTTGNLSSMEDTLLKGTLSELRMIFVKAPEQQKLIEAEMARQEELKKTYTDPSSAPTEVIHSDNSQEEE